MRTDYRGTRPGLKDSIHHSIRAAITLGFAFFIAYLVKGEYINLYIAPRMTFIVKLSAIALYLIGMIELVRAYRQLFGKKQTYACNCRDEHEHGQEHGQEHGHGQEHEHDHSLTGPAWKSAAIYGLFVLPLLLGFLLPNVAMGSVLAAKKGMNLSASTSGRLSAPSSERVVAGDNAARPQEDRENREDSTDQGDQGDQADPVEQREQREQRQQREQTPVKPNFPLLNQTMSTQELDERFQADMYTEDFARLAKLIYPNNAIEVKDELFMEILTALDIFIEEFQGKKVEISGFVYREPDMSQHQFVIGRFAMDCCSADALPYGVLVQFDDANRYANDTWLKLRGTISKAIYQDTEIMMFIPDKLTAIQTPASPYVYPNYDF